MLREGSRGGVSAKLLVGPTTIPASDSRRKGKGNESASRTRRVALKDASRSSTRRTRGRRVNEVRADSRVLLVSSWEREGEKSTPRTRHASSRVAPLCAPAAPHLVRNRAHDPQWVLIGMRERRWAILLSLHPVQSTPSPRVLHPRLSPSHHSRHRSIRLLFSLDDNILIPSQTPSRIAHLPLQALLGIRFGLLIIFAIERQVSAHLRPCPT